ARMRVERAVVAIEDAGADVGDVNLRDALELPGDRAVRVLHRRRVLLRRDLDDVFALQRVDGRLAEVIHHRAGADRRAVHLGEAIDHMGALVALHLRQEAIALQRARDARDRHAGRDERTRQARPHADDLHDVFLVRVEFTRDPPEPAFGPDLFGLAG